MILPAQDIVERLRKAMDGVTPGLWFEGDKWVFAPPLDPENNASFALRNILRDVPEDELQANCAYIALCSPDNIGALLDTISRLTADNEALGKELAESRAAHHITSHKAVKRLRALWREKQAAESRVSALSAEVERLKTAISWIEPPFVDENTSVEELRHRVVLCVTDAKRAALGGSDHA